MATKKELENRIEYRNEKGQLHREDGPAREYTDGTKEWYINDKLHRLDGPAVSWNDGTNYWFINGQNHREDGPAIEYNNSSVSFYLNDIRYSEQEWQEEIIKIKLDRLKNYGN